MTWRSNNFGRALPGAAARRETAAFENAAEVRLIRKKRQARTLQPPTHQGPIMSFLKSRTNPNASYAPPPELLEASSALIVAMDERARVDAAIATNAVDRQAAADARKHADAEVERIDLALALEFDDAKADALERALTAARMKAQTAATAAERAAKRQTALYGLAPVKDAAVAAAKQKFQTELAGYGRAVNEALAAEAQDASQHLVRVLRRGYAAAAAIGCLSQVSGFLGESTILSPAPGQQPIIGNGRADAVDGSRIDLAADWKLDPGAAALAELMEPLANLRRRAASFTPFTPPPPAAKSYEVSPANRRTAEELAAERAAADAASKPPASTWAGQCHHIGFANRPGHASPAEVSAVAGIDNAGAALAGGAQ